MSAKLAASVLESDLPAQLKFTAVTLALYANADVNRIIPSVGRVAWETGEDRSTIQRHLRALIRCGVVVPLTPRTGGRERTTRYHLDISACPIRPSWESFK